jgi:hypothetical protein
MPEQLIFEWSGTAPPRFDNFLAGSNGEVVAPHLRALAAGETDESRSWCGDNRVAARAI